MISHKKKQKNKITNILHHLLYILSMRLWHQKMSIYQLKVHTKYKLLTILV